MQALEVANRVPDADTLHHMFAFPVQQDLSDVELSHMQRVREGPEFRV